MVNLKKKYLNNLSILKGIPNKEVFNMVEINERIKILENQMFYVKLIFLVILVIFGISVFFEVIA